MFGPVYSLYLLELQPLHLSTVKTLFMNRVLNSHCKREPRFQIYPRWHDDVAHLDMFSAFERLKIVNKIVVCGTFFSR